MSAEAVRRHIGYKASVGELAGDVAGRMLAALDAGETPDYAALLRAATFLPLPSRVYHTAPRSARASIATEGLHTGRPDLSGHHPPGDPWVATQPGGVYVGPAPDLRGQWACEVEWDVWEIDTEGLPWEHDTLNPGNWIVLADVPATAIRLIERRA